MHRRRLLLLGGGHAHLEVLRRFAANPLADADVTLVTPHPLHRYSSSMPAALRGAFAERDGTFALDALARDAGVTLVLGSANEISGGASPRVRVGTDWFDADVLSLDVGSAPSTSRATGAAAHAHHVRSFGGWQALRTATDALFDDAGAPFGDQRHGASRQVVVVGGGAGGVEIALAIAARARMSRHRVGVTLIEAQPQLPMPDPARAILLRLLERAGVQSLFGARVVEVRPNSVQLESGREVESALTIWVAGAEAPAVLRESPTLPRTGDDFLRVSSSLQAIDGSPIFGAGDCVAIDGYSLDKAGVFAVREAPILADNLRAAIAERRDNTRAPRAYRPQRRYLSILDTSDGRALLMWGGVALHTRWALHLKRWLDDRFVARYRVPTARTLQRSPPHS